MPLLLYADLITSGIAFWVSLVLRLLGVWDLLINGIHPVRFGVAIPIIWLLFMRPFVMWSLSHEATSTQFDAGVLDVHLNRGRITPNPVLVQTVVGFTEVSILQARASSGSFPG